MTAQQFDRSREDTSNIVHLEHVNVTVPDQRLATLFYVSGLGLTRDPYLMASVDNMWVNVGRSQFHLPTGRPQVLRGHTGLVIPDRMWLLKRLDLVRDDLKESRFEVIEQAGCIEAVCPWGNRLRIHEPDPRFGRVALGMAYLAFDVPAGTAAAISRFYRDIFAAPAQATAEGGRPCAEVVVGRDQRLLFVEADGPLPAYDGHHIQVYLADFSGPYRRLRERGLVSQESSQWQYRFLDITDLDTGKVLFTIEHEVRSMTHPLYARPLVNRNPYQTNNAFAAGYESRSWELPCSG
ncbi:hypothetical protein FHP25_22345 [Vineibacter terrae]|uniref:VOC domain-containing protein n=1 Tax=Vineibacter terrae TaxID=2586908 RepID=A0A5C8PH96_9HYPH|nr:hypothetical protein [Vineibacter terrae]TXL73172.1 hypothetical protein FHP25_22345 [Vineibacter terrae]